MRGTYACDNVIVILRENVLLRWRRALSLAQVTPSTVGQFNDALRCQCETLRSSEDPSDWESADELEGYLIEARADFRLVVLPEERAPQALRSPGVAESVNRWIDTRLRVLPS